MIKLDTHVHSLFSFDGKTEADLICKAAVENNIAVLALTDHCDIYEHEKFGHNAYFAVEDACELEIKRLKERYTGKVKVLYGLELGQPYQIPALAKALLARHSYDMILGAVHVLSDGRDVYFIDYRDSGVVEDMFDKYFSDMTELLQFGGFDVLAHLDYPLRVLKGKILAPTMKKYEDRIEPILKLAAEKGIGLEVNTRGLLDWQNRVGPEDFVLTRYRELGGEMISIGSDSHRETTLGAGFDAAVAAVKAAGFSHITYFENRQAQKVAIE